VPIIKPAQKHTHNTKTTQTHKKRMTMMMMIRFPLCYYTMSITWCKHDDDGHNYYNNNSSRMMMKNATVILLISLTLNIKSKRVILHLPN
jgi:hypothetical protein